MNERDLQEALEHIAYIEAALAEISADVKSINSQLAAMQRREELRQHPRQN